MNTTTLGLEMRSQPDDVTCGPTCLHAVYRYHGDSIGLREVIDEVRSLETGGTLAAWLGCHALAAGYRATLYTGNLRLFDPTWFRDPRPDLTSRLTEQARAKSDSNLQAATRAYLGFLKRGGVIEMQDLSESLLSGLLERRLPIITGLSATWLHGAMRERVWDEEDDDIRGTSAGHFVVLSGYDPGWRQFMVSDPMLRTAEGRGGTTWVPFERLLGAIYLGVLTHDADLLVLEPGEEGEWKPS